MNKQQNFYPASARAIHLGLAVFGIAAFLTGGLAEEVSAGGYLIHAYLGLSLAAVIVLRLGAGLSSSPALGFRYWGLFTSEHWRQVAGDMRSLFSLRMPERGHHRGLAGLVQAFGLLLFAWMGLSGTWLFFLENTANLELFHLIEEGHEVGEILIPLYLLLHVAAVILHTLLGHAVWQRMFRVHH